MGKKFFECKECGKAFRLIQTLIYVGEFILGWIIMNVANVKKLVVKEDTLMCKREFILWKLYKSKILWRDLK